MAVNGNFVVQYKANMAGVEIDERIKILKLQQRSDNEKFSEMLTNAKPSMQTVRPESPKNSFPKRRTSIIRQTESFALANTLKMAPLMEFGEAF